MVEIQRRSNLKEPEVAALCDALLKCATNSDTQAAKWAREIIASLQAEGYYIFYDIGEGGEDADR